MEHENDSTDYLLRSPGLEYDDYEDHEDGHEGHDDHDHRGQDGFFCGPLGELLRMSCFTTKHYSYLLLYSK